MSFYGKRVGKFTVSVEEPSPPWVRIACENQDQWTIHPNELADLEYVLKAAREELERMNADWIRRFGHPM